MKIPFWIPKKRPNKIPSEMLNVVFMSTFLKELNIHRILRVVGIFFDEVATVDC